jgi:hypothetical protein
MTLDATISGTEADTYAELDEYTAYAAAFGWTLAATDAANEVNLRRAAVAIDAGYEFFGVRQYQFQTRQWPRLDVGIINGWPVNPDTIPQAIKDAQMEMAFAIQGGTDPLAIYEGAISRKREKLDVLEEETEYLGGKARPRFTAVDRILRDYITNGTGQTRMVRG